MYPGDFSIGQFFGFNGFGLDPGADGLTIAYADGNYTYWTDFIFQAMFAATAATIVSGAVAERIKLGPFLIFTTIYVALIYTIAGSWKWGGGWLDQRGFYDFAGSTLVHSVGGWAALAGIIVLGPRLGKYVDGKIRPVAGHSMPLATIGVPVVARLVRVQRRVGAERRRRAGVAGLRDDIAGRRRRGHRRDDGVWSVQHKPDLSMVLNGALAGSSASPPAPTRSASTRPCSSVSSQA